MPNHTVTEQADERRSAGDRPLGASDHAGLARRLARALGKPIVTSSIALGYFAFDLATDLRAGLPATHVAFEVVGLCVALAVLVGVLLRR